ncbi:uncharacterized protein LOC127798856 [Diospyros lotus]|uniref:uncharacterized protein LOC127798856 n=1 Tax=Diospyros lotus TaxID=55363 RepID=UPI0022585830|nr:uncharacterized protein LOC127798856 [Diospyros lotus]
MSKFDSRPLFTLTHSKVFPAKPGNHSKMGIRSARTTTTLLFSIIRPPLATHLRHHCRPYTPSPHQLGKIVRASETSRPFYISPPFNSYSYCSSSSSLPKMGFLRWYLGMLDRRPVATKAATSSLIYVAADLTSQMITLPPSGSFDTMRTLRMAGFGFLILGPSQHMWFNFVARIIPRRDVLSTLKKLAMGQLIYGPCINGIFFSFNAAALGEIGEEIIARLKRDLPTTLMNGLMFWPICDFLTYKVVPVHLQPLINSSFSYIWTIYLTYMANLKKAGID